MRTVSLRALHRDPPVDESVVVTHGGQIIGTFVPVAVELPDALAGVHAAPASAARGMSQAEKDTVLRRVAKGGKS
jgi:hypothetical protein